jgi:acyl carrier protein
MGDVRARLTTCFSAVFPSVAENRIPDATASTVQEWDSVASVTLLATIEEEFGVEIDVNDLAELLSFQSILAYLEANSDTRGQG